MAGARCDIQIGRSRRRHAPAHGSTTSAPVVPESVTFRVTTVIPSTMAVAAYYAMVEFLDEVIGGVLATLDRCGQRDDTLVLFMSDHGEMLGYHGLLLKGCRFYEGLVRVPLLLSWPRGLPNGVACYALVELVDIAPTLLWRRPWSRWPRCTGAPCCTCCAGATAPPSTAPWCAASTTGRCNRWHEPALAATRPTCCCNDTLALSIDLGPPLVGNRTQKLWGTTARGRPAAPADAERHPPDPVRTAGAR